MTTKEDISVWFDRGLEQKSKYMLVMCDTWDYSDYPVFCDAQECLGRYNHPGEFTRVMEVYALDQDKEEQLNRKRCFNLPL